MQPASAEQPWGFQANGEPGISVQCCFVSHLKVLKAFLFFSSFALSVSFYEPEVCQALTPASTTSAKWIFGHGNPCFSCSLPQHRDFILTPLCRVEKSRAGVTPDVLSLSFFFLFRFRNVSLQEMSLFKQFLESLMEEVRELGISSAPGS